MKVYAERIRQLRTKRGYSQDRLASLLGISRSAVGMYETGQREPDFETCEAIADIFNVDMDYLIGRSDVENAWSITPHLDDVYLRFAKQAQDEGIDPSDIQLAIDTIKRLRGE